MNMSRKTLAWANKEVETFLCILGEEDVQRELDGAVEGMRRSSSWFLVEWRLRVTRRTLSSVGRNAKSSGPSIGS